VNRIIFVNHCTCTPHHEKRRLRRRHLTWRALPCPSNWTTTPPQVTPQGLLLYGPIQCKKMGGTWQNSSEYYYYSPSFVPRERERVLSNSRIQVWDLRETESIVGYFTPFFIPLCIVLHVKTFQVNTSLRPSSLHWEEARKNGYIIFMVQPHLAHWL
jgi:hypothetical protein